MMACLVGGCDDGVFGGTHVGDDAVGDDEKHLVIGGAVFVQGCNSRDMVDHRREIGRSVELNGVERVMVSCHHPIDALAVGAGRGEVQEELMADVAVGRETSSESESRKHLVRVVVLDDLPHRVDGSQVLVWPTCWVEVVKRG